MVRYAVFVRADDDWVEVAQFDAADNVDAFRQIGQHVPADHHGKPIALQPLQAMAKGSRPFSGQWLQD